MSFLVRIVKESGVWRSLFRQPYPTTSRTRVVPKAAVNSTSTAPAAKN